MAQYCDRARAVNVVQIERRRIWISDSATNKMDGLIPVTRPIREDKLRTRSEAMEVDVMGPPPGEESDSEGECGCAALYARGRGGPCYYCTKEGNFLRSCPRKATGLPRSAPFIEDKGVRRDDARWKDQPPTQQEWGKGRYQEERGPPLPPKGNRREPWREEPGRERGPRSQQGGATQALEEEDGVDASPEMNVLCKVDSDGEEGIFGLRRWGTSATRRLPPPSPRTRKRRTRRKKEPRRRGVSTCWPPLATSAPGPLWTNRIV